MNGTKVLGFLINPKHQLRVTDLNYQVARVLGSLTVIRCEPERDGDASFDRIIANLEIENLRLVV
ncbi:MAG TPA: hypothetical protein QF397_02815, partial [Candidatus Poseidoniia archaeon]|nr:hypothetical protein [Candidatus Poseidoniia archaeon]